MKTSKSVNTCRKTKIIGTQQYINRDTGEIIDCQVMEIEERDANFQKFWIGHILAAVDELSNAKMKLVFYIIKNMDYSNNTLIKTIQEIINETGFSKMTVVETLKVLEKYDIIRRKTGVIFLNPNVLFKGGTNKRRAVLIKYNDLKNQPELPFKDEQEENEKAIALSAIS
ncbi:MAG: replication/maintenance protein [Hydrococcus sp. RU_2_2]|nr:replication/maintenance protein [Hydrococcus sp. RU_2_2]